MGWKGGVGRAIGDDGVGLHCGFDGNRRMADVKDLAPLVDDHRCGWSGGSGVRSCGPYSLWQSLPWLWDCMLECSRSR